jgi:transposase
LRCERGSVDVVCPPLLPTVDDEEDGVRAVALDVHRDFCEVAIVAEGRLRSAGRIQTGPEALELFARSLAPEDWVALEVTGNAWAIAAILEPHVARVIVVSPTDTGIRQARVKTDRLDARTLAKLLWAGELDGVWTPDERVRVMRRRLARRAQLVRARSRVKNEIHAVLMRCLKDRPPAADLFGVKGRRWLADQQLALCERETVDGGLRQVDLLASEIAQVERLIAAAALGWPEVKRLMTVPGVNVIVAATFMAAVGDIRRFGDRRKLTAYLGLDPRVRQSGAGPANQGHISKQGSNSARHPLVEACWSTVRQPGPIAAFYQRVRARRGHSIAIVAAARKLACVFWCLLTRGEDYAFAQPSLTPEEDAPPRAAGRRPALQGRTHRLVHQRRHAQRRTRTRAPGPTRLRTHDHRPAGHQGGCGRDTGARIIKAVYAASSAADLKAPAICALARRSPAPTRSLAHDPGAVQGT